MRSCVCSAGFAGVASPGPWAAPPPAAGATAKLVSLCAVSSRQHDTWLPSAPSIDHDRSVASCEPDTTSGDEPASPADGLPGTNPQQVTDCVCPRRSKSSLLCRRSHTLSSQPWPSKPLEQLTKSCPSAETAQHVKTLLCAPSKTPAGCDRSRVSHTRSRKSSDACHTHHAARQRGAGGARAAPAGLCAAQGRGAISNALGQPAAQRARQAPPRQTTPHYDGSCSAQSPALSPRPTTGQSSRVIR